MPPFVYAGFFSARAATDLSAGVGGRAHRQTASLCEADGEGLGRLVERPTEDVVLSRWGVSS